MKTAKILGNIFMSESTVNLLNNPYGKVSFDTFRIKNRAFVDKSLSIKFLDDDSMSDYPVLLRPRRLASLPLYRCSSATMTFPTRIDMRSCFLEQRFMMWLSQLTTATM